MERRDLGPFASLGERVDNDRGLHRAACDVSKAQVDCEG